MTEKKKNSDGAQAVEDTAAAAAPESATVEAPVDERDEQIAALKRELARARQGQPETAADARDETIRKLKAELDEIKATPEGEAGELRKAFEALQRTVERMAAGQGLVPLPTPDKPDPLRFGVLMGCGHTTVAAHPQATAHHCDEHGTVPITNHWLLSPEMQFAANN